jgi:phthalate 4,5-cis-dihydrodiol dehydrogenase
MKTIALGVAGLGRAFALMAPTLAADARVRLVAAADPRPEARQRFEADFGGRTYGTVEELCRDAAMQAVYVATPNQHHATHAQLAAHAGKHLLVEKPMALSLEECRSMTDTARRHGVQLVVGHSHSFDAPIALARQMIQSGRYGRLRMITALNFTDFLYRPRWPEELDTTRGGGAVFNQAAHHVDIARMLAGGQTRWVRAVTGAWDSARPTEGAYSCLIGFDNGVTATLTYSGYAHFDSDELLGWVGELGQRKDRAGYWKRPSHGDEVAAKNARNYGGPDYKPLNVDALHQHFGFLVASCERADLRPQPDGVMIYADDSRRLESLPPPKVPRAEVIDELYAAVVEGRSPLHDGDWGAATLEVCLAILRSSREGEEVTFTSPTASRT